MSDEGMIDKLRWEMGNNFDGHCYTITQDTLEEAADLIASQQAEIAEVQAERDEFRHNSNAALKMVNEEMQRASLLKRQLDEAVDLLKLLDQRFGHVDVPSIRATKALLAAIERSAS